MRRASLLLWALIVALTGQASGAPASTVAVVARGVSAQATAENSQRKLLAAAPGRLLLTYVRPVREVDQVFLAESSHGRAWRSTQVTRAPHPARLPSLAIFPDASLHLVWTEYAPVGRVLHRERRGSRWGASTALSPAGVYAGVPAVAPRQGRPHVLWYGILPERPQVATRHGSIYEIVFTRQDAAWSSPVSISPGVPDSINPSLGAGADGVLHAAWYQFDGRVYQIRYTRFDGRWAAPRSLTRGPTEHTRVALAVDGSDVHLVWEEPGDRGRVVYLRLGAPPVVLAEGQVREPVIAAAGDRVVAAWSDGPTITLRPIRPSGATVRLGSGSSPALALRGTVAYVAWTTADAIPELRLAAVAWR